MSLDAERSELDRIPANAPAPPHGPRPSDRRGFWFVVAVCAVVVIGGIASYVVYSAHPIPTPTQNLVFSPAILDARGNATFAVENVSNGPYAASGFRLDLIVNGFSGPPVSLPAAGETVRIAIGPNAYRLAWNDTDHDGFVSRGDSFVVSGDGSPLPSLSSYEIDFTWQNTWAARVVWSTP